MLGTYVVNAGVWEPLALASQVATLDVVSGGRAVLGIGAGHTPAEWTMRGVDYPSPGGRVDRMVELVGATRRLLAGETVSVDGDHVTLVEARLDRPQAVQQPIPLLIGGGGRRVMRYADVQYVDVTDDPDKAADGFAEEVPGLTADDVLGAPFVWIGTVEQIAERLRGHRERWGITRYVVRPPAMETAHEVLAALG